MEAQARRDGADVNELGQRRQQGSVRVLADIEALLLANLHAVLPKSLLGQALHYLASQWSSGASSSGISRMVATASTTTHRKTPYGRSASGGATGCSPTRWPAPTPAQFCTRCCRPVSSPVHRHRRPPSPARAVHRVAQGPDSRRLRRAAALAHRPHRRQSGSYPATAAVKRAWFIE